MHVCMSSSLCIEQLRCCGPIFFVRSLKIDTNFRNRRSDPENFVGTDVAVNKKGISFHSADIFNPGCLWLRKLWQLRSSRAPASNLLSTFRLRAWERDHRVVALQCPLQINFIQCWKHFHTFYRQFQKRGDISYPWAASSSSPC